MGLVGRLCWCASPVLSSQTGFMVKLYRRRGLAVALLVFGRTKKFCPAGLWLWETGQDRNVAALTAASNACGVAEWRKAEGS